MTKTYLFLMVSLDGFFEGPGHDLDWHNVDREFVAFAIRQLDDTGVLLFGRRTYEMMAEYWPSEAAVASDPETAKRMNGAPKVVFSNTLREARWQNTTLVPGDRLKDTVEGLKRNEQKDIAVLGSSDLAVSMLRLGLLDELRIMVNPVVLGAGKRMLEGTDGELDLRLSSMQSFMNGNVLLRYHPRA
jgi:dihydrofolate reductase